MIALTPDRIAVVKFLAAGTGAALLIARGLFGSDPTWEPLRRFGRILFAVVAIFGGACWWNLLAFHFAPPGTPLGHVHTWDVFHYYVGAKYFRELGYTDLYRCTSEAEAEAGADVSQRVLRNLADNSLEPLSVARAREAPCHTQFDAERWLAFRHDVAWFREHVPFWERIHLDWGYNATPVWNLFGSVLAQTAPASDLQILWLTQLDTLGLLAAWAIAAWGFGYRAWLVGLLFWGTNFIAGGFSFTGGGFLRHLWFLAAVAGLALLRKNRPLLGGVALGLSTLLTIFPGLAIAAVLLQAPRDASSRRARQRFGVGVLLSGVLLLPAAAVGGGPRAWIAFARNSVVDSAPSPNNFGLKTLLAYRHESRIAAVPNTGAGASTWEDLRRQAYAERRVLHGAIAGALLALAGWALRGRAQWLAAALAFGMVPVIFELSNYYAVILVALAFISVEIPAMQPILPAFAALTWLLAYLYPAQDEALAWCSGAALVVLVTVIVLVGRAPRPDASLPAN